jgi:hypothetical protein
MLMHTQTIAGPSSKGASKDWATQLRPIFGTHRGEVDIASDRKVVVTVDPAIAEDVMNWLTDQEEVLWVELRPKFVFLNKYAKAVIQDSTLDASQYFLWNKGLTGAGQVVGCADTGVDFDSCFFR